MGYRPQSADTEPRAEAIQFAIYARMTAAEKVERVRALSRMANRLSLEGLRRRHPGEAADDLRRRLLAMRVGETLAERIIPRADERRTR